MNKHLGIALVSIILIGGGVYAYLQSSSSRSYPSPSEALGTVQSAAVATTTYAMAEVAQHASQNDCWVVVNNTVYNMTSFISEHPGGARAITQTCGADGTSIYAGERAHTEPGAPEQMVTFAIGTVQG